MKMLTRLAVVLLLLASALPSASLAQARSRGLIIKNYESGKTDGMRILIYKVEANLLVPVDPGRNFSKGDEIKVAFESNFDGYVYFINVSPRGKSKVLFPYASESNNVIRSRQRYELPSTGTIAFDEEKGVEILQVIMSRERLPVLDDAIKNSNGNLGESAASAAAELAGTGSKSQKSGIVSENVAIALPQGGGPVRSRGIILAAGKDKDKNGSVVGIPDTKGKDGKLKPGEIAVFEIRLKHI